MTKVIEKARKFLAETYQSRWAINPRYAYEYYRIKFENTDDIIMTRNGYSKLVIELATQKGDLKL